MTAPVTEQARNGLWERFWESDLGESVAALLKYTVWAVGVGCVVALLFFGYEELDRRGWVPHRHETNVAITGNWMVGEYRGCMFAEGENNLYCFQSTENGVGITEDSHPEAFHVLPVEYWGRIDRQDDYGKPENPRLGVVTLWKCQRKQDSVKCWATA